MKVNKIFKTLSITGLVILSGITLTACGSKSPVNSQDAPKTNKQQPQQKQVSRNNVHTKSTAYASNSNNKLANMVYKPGSSAVVVLNHNHAQLSNKWSNDHAKYSNLDKLSRTSRPNTGWLDKQNVANDSLRTRQTYKPVGYRQKFINNKPILNRGHEIAYSLSKGISQNGTYNPKAKSGDQNNAKNLFTQTAFSNQELQTIYESKVRNALKQGKKVVYQVQPVFKGNNDMATGVHMQALSTDKKLNYNVFIYNVQPGVKFNYTTGTSSNDSGMKVPTPAGAPHFNDNNQRSTKFTNHHFIRRHHIVRRYAEYRLAKHLIRRHYYKKRMRRVRIPYHSHRFSIHRHRL